MRKVVSKAIFIIGSLVSIPYGACAQVPMPAAGDLQIKKLPCGPTAPPRASVTDLSTGHGVRFYRLPADLDKVPPCGGQTGPVSPVGTYPLPVPVPQLVKVR